MTQSNVGCSAEIEGVNGPGETLAEKDVVAWCLRVGRSAQVQDSMLGWKAFRGAGALEELEEGQGGWSTRAIVSMKKELTGPGLHLRPVHADCARPPFQWTLNSVSSAYESNNRRIRPLQTGEP